MLDDDGLLVEAVSTSETPVNWCQTTRRSVQENKHLRHNYIPSAPL